VRLQPSLGPCAVAALAAAAAAPLAAQQPPASVVERLERVEAAVARETARHPGAIWPGFRPDTVPALYVVPGIGSFLLGWPGADLPDGYADLAGRAHAGWRPAAPRGAASTGVALAGRSVAQVVVAPGDGEASIYGTRVHEAFHVFARAEAREGRRFGTGENAFLVTSYPVFSPSNEAGWALEGKLLSRAVAAPDRLQLRARAQEFVAARESRHRTLGSEFAGFEAMAELNEGLAEYTLVRSLELAAADPDLAWRADAARELRARLARLDSLTADGSRSLRLRFYVTGPAVGLILDRLAGPGGWKADLMRRDRTLQDELADVSGYRDRERALLARAARGLDTAALGRGARAAIARLRARRRREVDSVLARPGLTVVLRADSLPGRAFGLCGIDPQNLLQVDSTVLLHTRWVRPCGSGVSAEFTAPAAQDRLAGTFTAVVGPPDSVRFEVGGEPVSLRDGDTILGATDVRVESPGLMLQAVRADLQRRAQTVEVRPLRR
jgi:hypothetical protein